MAWLNIKKHTLVLEWGVLVLSKNLTKIVNWIQGKYFLTILYNHCKIICNVTNYVINLGVSKDG